MNDTAAIAPVALGFAINAEMDVEPGSANPIVAK